MAHGKSQTLGAISSREETLKSLWKAQAAARQGTEAQRLAVKAISDRSQNPHATGHTSERANGNRRIQLRAVPRSIRRHDGAGRYLAIPEDYDHTRPAAKLSDALK